MNEQLQDIIARILNVDSEKILPESKPDDFEEWDSLAMIAIISEIQDKMGVEIPFEKMMAISSVKDFIEIVGE